MPQAEGITHRQGIERSECGLRHMAGWRESKSCGEVAPRAPLARGPILCQPKFRFHCSGDGKSSENLKQGNYMSSILETLWASE